MLLTGHQNAQKPLHARHEIGIGRLDRKVRIIGHQAIRMDLPDVLVQASAMGAWTHVVNRLSKTGATPTNQTELSLCQK